MDKKKVISVMIPCYNEEENVRPICEAVRAQLTENCSGYDYEILFIDNKSKDRTREILRQLCAEDPHVAMLVVAHIEHGSAGLEGLAHLSQGGETAGSNHQVVLHSHQLKAVEVVEVCIGEVECQIPVTSGNARNGKRLETVSGIEVSTLCDGAQFGPLATVGTVIHLHQAT